MTQDSKFTIQLLEKIGAPLAVAIDHVLPDGDEKQVEAAQIMAQLLGQATQMSTVLYNALEIKEDEKLGDSTRLALAALVSPLIAESYKHRKQVLTEAHMSRIQKSLEALISFGENFSPAADHKSRLQTIDYDAVFFDKDQPNLVILQAMIPVVNAVEEFSFGQGRIKLIQDVATKLESVAADMSKKLGATDKLKELIIFKALAALYTSCHVTETKNAPSSNDVELSLDPVWDSFAMKVSMIEAFMGLEGDSKDAKESKEPVKATSEASEEKPIQAEEAKPQVEKPAAGPMGFFKKDEGEDKAEPQSEPVAASEKTEPTATPAAAETKIEEAPSSPMGFFKPGATKKEDTKT